MPKLDEYLTVKQAAAFLGVSSNTIRNWGKSGVLTEYRHPVNRYRLFRPEDLDRLLKKVTATSKPR